MGLFSFLKKKPSNDVGVVGIDVGAGGIKACEIARESGRSRLLSYGYTDWTSQSDKTQTSLLDQPKYAASLIDELHRRSGMKSLQANVSLPSHSVFHAIITIPAPKEKKDDLKPLIESQVKKLLAIPVQDMILDSQILDPISSKKESAKSDAKAAAGQRTTDTEHVRVLVSGAPKTLVQKYIDIFKLSKLNLTGLETEAFALIRSLVGEAKEKILLVDIGFERTNITIVHEGIPFLHRSVKAGGGNITRLISKQMGVSLEEAEQTKLDLAFTNGAAIPPVLQEAMQPILHEVKYSLELFAAQEFHQGSTVEKIVITGGSAHLPHIDQILTSALNMNVYLGDPWARVSVPKGLGAVLDEVGPRFSVAAGLALKKTEKN